MRKLLCAALAGVSLAGAVGCQSYAPIPLDPAAHRAEWNLRAPDAKPVSAFAERLIAVREGTSDTSTHFDPADGISLAEAEIIALFYNPELRLARLDARVPLASADELARWPDPEFAIDSEFILANEKTPFVLGAGIGFSIPLTGRLDAERALKLAEFDAAQWAVHDREQALVADLRRAWAEWSAIFDRQQLIREYLADLDAIRATVETLVKAGEANRAELRLFAIETASANGELAVLDARAVRLALDIRAMLGLVPTAPVNLVPSLTASGEVPDAGERIAALEANHPRLAQLRAEYQAAEDAVKLEIDKQVPDFSLAVGYINDQGQSRIGLNLGLPIPALNANRAGIADARARRAIAGVVIDVETERLIHALAQAEADWLAAKNRTAYLRDTVAPLIDEQIADARNLAEMGQFDAMLQLDAIRQHHDAQLAILESIETEIQSLIRLQALVGKSYVPATLPEEKN